MYFYLGGGTVTEKKNVIGVFDIENATLSKHTKSFLFEEEKNGRIINVSLEMPKSFVVCADENMEKVFISHVSTGVLRERYNEKERMG
jgi:hypothetical protein